MGKRLFIFGCWMLGFNHGHPGEKFRITSLIHSPSFEEILLVSYGSTLGDSCLRWNDWEVVFLGGAL